MSVRAARQTPPAEDQGTQPTAENLPDAPRLIAGRFRIGIRLGAGGMGEVFEAEDTLLHRKVAVKQVAPRLRSDADYRRRLMREARRASSLNHPNIAQIYDAVEDARDAFIVMEFLPGISLRDRLQRPAEMKDFLRIATQCGEALDFAHQQGILHGDMKPENVMLSPAGNAKVLDFGLAKRLPGAKGSLQSLDTTAPTFEGTPAYMAPEVLRGEPADPRADIFSLGVLFYEMLSGTNPFKAETLASTCERVLNLNPEPLRMAGSQRIPQQVGGIVHRMLAKEPERRYATAAAVVEALREAPTEAIHREKRWLGRASVAASAVALVAFLAAGSGNGLRRIRDRMFRPSIPAIKQLAVLPVAVEGNDNESTAFASGLMDTVTGRIGQLTEQRWLDVIPASEVLAKGVSSVDQARQEFGVNLVLRVAIHRAGNLLRISPVLLDARTHRELRARVVTDSIADPFSLQDRVADLVVEELGLELGPEDRKVMQEHGTSRSAAYDPYLQGRGYLREIEKSENIDRAITEFRQAVEKDPAFGLAYAGLGDAYWAKYEQLKDRQWIARATEMCNRAASAGNAGAEGEICLGELLNGQGEYAEAEDHYRKALNIDRKSEVAYVGLATSLERLAKPDQAELSLKHLLEFPECLRSAYNQLGGFYGRQGRYADAVEMFKRYVDFAPDAFVGYYNLGAMEVIQGKYPEAIQALNHSIAIRPTAEAYSNLGTAFFSLRQYNDAVPAFEHAAQLDEHRYDYWGNLGDAYYWSVQHRNQAPDAYRKAILLGDEALRVNPRDADTTIYVAQYHAMLGDREDALKYMQRALQLAPKSPDSSFNAAIIYSQLGDADKAIRQLTTALAAGYPANQVDATPNFEGLRSNKRFQQLMQRFRKTERENG